jgi:hypothetical protein
MNARWRGRCEGEAVKRHGENRVESFGIWEAE